MPSKTSKFTAQLNQLGHLLTVLEVIRGGQWSRVARLGSTGKIMDALENEPAWWSAAHPAINSYQRRRIAAGEFNGFRDLDRELRVNNFLLLDELGQGGMGYVHKAWSIDFHRFVAVKRTGQGHHKNRERLERESRILEMLDDPVIAQYVAWEPVEDGGGFILAMEYIHGETLRQHIDRNEQVSAERTTEWAVSILHALKHAHSRHVIHRDVTPRNIMVIDSSNSLAVKLLDFGLGKIREGVSNAFNVPEINFDLTQDNQALGTPQYMSPELWRDAATVTGSSDVYSLGCNLYEMLAGRTPFAEVSGAAVCLKHMETPPPDLAMFRSDIPDRLRYVIHQMLEKQPERRGTPDELINQLQVRKQSLSSLMSAALTGPAITPTAVPTQSAPPSEDVYGDATAELEEAAARTEQLAAEPSLLPRPDWKRRLIPQSPLSTAARCVEPGISGVDVYERLISPAWMAFVVGVLALLCFTWLMMG